MTKELENITEDYLIKLLTSQKFHKRIRQSSGKYDHEKAFGVYHEIFGENHLITKVVSGNSEEVSTSKLEDEANRKFKDNYYELFLFHYHDYCLEPSFEDLTHLNNQRYLIMERDGVNVRPIIAIGKSTDDKSVPFVLIQQKTRTPLNFDFLMEEDKYLFDEDYCECLGNAEFVAKRMEESGLYTARAVRINKESGLRKQDLKKLKHFSFELERI